MVNNTVRIRVFSLQDYKGYMELTSFISRRRIVPGMNLEFTYKGKTVVGNVLEVGKTILIRY